MNQMMTTSQDKMSALQIAYMRSDQERQQRQQRALLEPLRLKMYFISTSCIFALSLLTGCPEKTEGPLVSQDMEPPVDRGEVIELDEDLADGDTPREMLDAMMSDAEPPPPLESAYGEPCRANRDCLSGFCIASPQGFLCSQPCLLDEDCTGLEQPMSCSLYVENFGPDLQQICSPDESSLCQPCFRDDHCFGGRCITTAQGNVCTASCGEEQSCPSGSECRDADLTGSSFDEPQCVPDVALCGCSVANAGEERSCVRAAQGFTGRCFGVEVCDPETGWSGCDAPAPVEERCDGVDNDCNGAIDDGLSLGEVCANENEYGRCEGTRVCGGAAGWSCVASTPEAELCDLRDNDCDEAVDEAFKDELGRYNTPEHCGACGVSCAERFPLANATVCVLGTDPEDESGAETYRCEVSECRAGFFLASTNTCLPLSSKLCEPCERDTDCNVDSGDRCLTYGEGSGFCGRDCSADSPFGEACPEGFICDDSSQCRLTVGNCICSESDSFIIPCSVTSPVDPEVRCVGSLTCDRGELSSCELPAERCDSFDDDCDGSVDEDFTDPATGFYVSDQHCGRCDLDCTALVSGNGALNGVGVCDSSGSEQGDEPRCDVACNEGYVDVNGVLADGCECTILDAQRDAPDPLGIDANCDGIDGEVPRGIFVAPSGDDNAPGTRAEPMRTIQAAIDRADNVRDHVYVAAGVYTEQVTLRAGVSLFGGYSADYTRRDLRGNETAIFPPLEVNGERFGTINGFNITGSSVTVSGFTIIGYAESRPSRSSYAVYLRDCDESLSITDNVIRAGSGGPGLRGQSGTSGQSAPDNATAGSPERASSSPVCVQRPENVSSGGQGGRHSCVDGAGRQQRTDGGDGGSADCPVFDVAEPSGEDGVSGEGASGGQGGYNQQLLTSNGRCFCLIPSADNATDTGIPGDSGEAGDNGGAGGGCASDVGRVIDGHWVAGDAGSNLNGRGQVGFDGAPGGGGGGGGAGSGVQRAPSGACNDLYGEVIGGGGGGGGAGGCGGTGGEGGSSGGGAFALFIFYTDSGASLPTISNNVIERGFGGPGGDGGAGGEGGQGGLGREALALSSNERVELLVCADPGGRGGDGGEGGNGGGGGGGCGGISTGIFIYQLEGAAPATLNADNTFPATGAGGIGGNGGLSLGQIGLIGADGQYVEVAQ